jgi:hypothetical protein
MKKTFLQYLFLSCSVMLLFSACRKDPYKGKETLQKGKTYVWITEAQQNNQFFLPFTTVKPVTMFSVRRDAANDADLQKAVTVTLTAINMHPGTDSTFLKKYGDYTLIPATLGTPTTDNSITTSGNTITMNFAAGVYAKNYVMNIDGNQFDPSKKYAIAYTITNHGGFSGKHDASGVSLDTIVAVLGVKNIYDGVYSSTGSFVRVGLDSRTWTLTKTLGTVNINTVQSSVADLGTGDPLNLTVNADNTVTVTFVGGSLDNLPSPYTQVGTNTYDPATKTFTLTYQYRGMLRNATETLVLN